MLLPDEPLPAQDVAKILTARGPAEGRHKIVDPGAPHLLTKPDDDPRPQPEFDGVMSLTVQINSQYAILLICPASTTLRLYLLANEDATNEYCEPKLTTLVSDVASGQRERQLDHRHGDRRRHPDLIADRRVPGSLLAPFGV